jgi:hypothetical protein
MLQNCAAGIYATGTGVAMDRGKRGTYRVNTSGPRVPKCGARGEAGTITEQRKRKQKMKLAEALLERADAQRRYAQLQERASRIVRVQSGDTPAEDPNALIAEMLQISARVESLVKSINRSNCATEFASGVTLADALASRDALAQRRASLSELAKAATTSQDRYSRSEVKFESTISVAATQKAADTIALEHRTLDAKIQALNWSVDLME